MTVTRLASEDMVSALAGLCVSIGSKYAIACESDIRHFGAFRALKRAPPPPQLYSDPVSFANDWQVYNLLRKFPGLPGSSPRSRLETAVSSFVAAEQRCRLMNQTIRSWRSGLTTPILWGGSLSGASLVLEVQRQIAMILGPFNRKTLLAECRWSGGATATSRRGTPTSQKISSVLASTPSALKWAQYVIKRDPAWTEAAFGFRAEGPFSFMKDAFLTVDGSRVVSVPKTAYTDRTIAAEAALNGFLQQGFSQWLRRRLKKWGCDLDDQSINQRGAQAAFTSSLSTLDLESASDSVSLELVRLLLPHRFCEYLEDLRSPFALIGSRRLKLEKFSSMGNSFTFELESLIFLCICRAVESLRGSRRVATVYGDDIVCGREVTSDIISALELFGFVINKTKSFVDGNFFESCGKHYFQGTDVTPAYITSPVLDVKSSIVIYNKMIRWSLRIYSIPFSSPVRAFMKVIKWPDRRKYQQPLGDIDIGYITFDVVFPFCRNRGYWLTGIEERSSLKDYRGDAALLAYKLRRSTFENSSPKGYSLEVDGSRSVKTVRYWPEAMFAGRSPS